MLLLQPAVFLQQLTVIHLQIFAALQGLANHLPVQLKRVWSRLELHRTQVHLKKGGKGERRIK